MKKLINSLKKLEKEKSNIYCGKGVFTEFTIDFKSGISEKEVKASTKLNLPGDYVELLKFSNGVNFFEYSDCQIYNLQTAIELSKIDCWANNDILCIATCHEDSIYLKCDGSERNIYVSEEGIEELRALNMSFKAFLEAGLISGFSYFWLWGTANYDLY